MSGNIHGISWFPNFPDKFVSWGQEINLYEVRNKDDVLVGGQQQKSRLPYIPVNFLSNETRYQYARCVAASYHSDQPIIAVGLADGKIGICNFRDTYDSGWEYSKPPHTHTSFSSSTGKICDILLICVIFLQHRDNSACARVWHGTKWTPTFWPLVMTGIAPIPALPSGI